ncbi:MAG: RloB family protein [Erysipelotrichaceae bacterium]
MSRTLLSDARRLETRKTNIGKIIIFCEGKTEKFYFDYFIEIIKQSKYTDVEVIVETANGNAQTVQNLARSFMENEENNRKYSTYCQYLVFDCDAPPNIQDVVLSSNGYELLISNFLFETWLLMHFEEVNTKLTKSEIYRRLTHHLRGDYSKAHKGKIREIVQNGSIEKAIDNAKTLEFKYEEQGKNIFVNINEMNPYTSVHKLIEQFMVEIS